MRVINTANIPAIESLKADERALLGLFKDFRNHAEISEFIPESCRLSLRWVRLQASQTLEPQQLPVRGMVIVTDGSGELLGGVPSRVHAGDIVLIPPGALHGLVGGSPSGLSAISVHFEGEGARWDTPCLCAASESDGPLRALSPLDRLVEENEAHAREFLQNPLMQLVRSGVALSDDVKLRMLGALQIWSDAFQRVLCARIVFESHPRAKKIAEDHLLDEVGHNRRLARMHGSSRHPSWDRGIAAASSWFVEKMGSASTEERAVLVHFVIERCADLLLTASQRVFPDADYFSIHAQVDADHFQLGYDLLKTFPRLDLPSLRAALTEGWQMMNMLCHRISDIAVGAPPLHAPPPSPRAGTWPS
ncbi:cupin domain-containing protein [Sorangium sp. So ce131]|uniref:cupin domain-containing protein n=1 Tax=Sorangium sp. So ce131 TaxID=3133282 RepID=UPI003F6487E4